MNPVIEISFLINLSNCCCYWFQLKTDFTGFFRDTKVSMSRSIAVVSVLSRLKSKGE